jgi:MoaA/NifB/PqqE/SkfB family radical SAM enzyme
MTGGEPMVSPENTKILEILIHSGYASQISLMLNTNGTQYNKKFIDLLTQFKVVKICLSIDDIFERIEYQRYPSEWAKIEVNVKKFISLQATHKNVFINLTPTVSVFNVFYLNEYLDWTKTIDYSFMYFNILHYDPCYSIKNLPLTIKKILLEKLTDPALSSVINFLNLPGDANIFNQFYENVRVLDEHRNQKFSVIFPQWENLLRTHINE